MLLSIIIPTLNEEKYLPRLLADLRKQSFTDYEIIVSDGGSKDRTAEIAKVAGCHFIVDDRVKHPSHQRNNGAKIAQGELLMFFDADTELTREFLEKSISEFKRRKLTAAGYYIKFNPNQILYKFFAFFFNLFLWSRQYLGAAAVGAGLMAERRAHDLINGFDERLYVAEDYDYCYRLAKVGRFRLIKSCKLLYSSRRLEQDGKFKTLFRWLMMGIFTSLNLKIKKKIVRYDFGKF